MEITERAGNYAEGKANEAITKAIAQAYADGYRDGYKDREEEIPVDLRDNKTEYVDLGLPSGTLWSNDYEKENGETLYLPYGEAAKYAIPTEEQWKELREYCEWILRRRSSGEDYSGVTCIGPNGNSTYFEFRGRKEDYNDIPDNWRCYFWILDNEDNIEKNNVFIGEWNRGMRTKIEKTFSGYKLPVRLVRKKIE